MIDMLWQFIVLLIFIIGVYFSIVTRCYQVRILVSIRRVLREALSSNTNKNDGVSPIRICFSSIGGMVGIGNIAGVVTTITIGGPGGLLWLWVGSLIGMLIKYCEVYLGIKYRQYDGKVYNGGPMFYLSHAFKSKLLPYIASVFLGLYAIEIFQFNVLLDTVINITSLGHNTALIFLLSIILYIGLGGVKKFTNFCFAVMPFFILMYIGLALYIIWDHSSEFTDTMLLVFHSAFNGHAAIGGFAGSTISLAISKGFSMGVYSGDIGIGYDSTIQSESRVTEPHLQARLSIFALFADTFLCTMTVLMVLITGTWQMEGIQISEYVVIAIDQYTNYGEYLISAIYIITGLTTVTGYLIVGRKCAQFIHKKFGAMIYTIFSLILFILFSFCDQSNTLILMELLSGILVICNIIGIFKLRNEVQFK